MNRVVCMMMRFLLFYALKEKYFRNDSIIYQKNRVKNGLYFNLFEKAIDFSE